MLSVYTFGDFDVRVDGKSVLETKGYPHRMMKLFKYFLTFKGKKLLPENIVDDLWSDNDYVDPKNVLRTQISRVRKMIEMEVDKDKSFYTIEYKNGYYVFEINDNSTLDNELFENYLVEGNLLKEIDSDRSLLLLEKGLKLYKGEYLQEMDYEEWLVPIRNRYHRLYLQGLFNYIEILKQKNMHQEIVNICEEAIHHEPYGENLHIYFIEALMEVGEKRYAMSHYEYITSRLYNHLGIKPSPRMKMIYKQLQLDEENIENTINFNCIESELEGNHGNSGALICEPYYFKFLYNLEIRKKSRDTEDSRFLGIITIEDRGPIILTEKDQRGSMETLINIVYNNLRKDDVLSKWNDKQLVSLHYDLIENDLNIIINRLKQKFKEQITDKNIRLNIRFKPMKDSI